MGKWESHGFDDQANVELLRRFGAVLTQGAFEHIVGELMKSTIGGQLSNGGLGVLQQI